MTLVGKKAPAFSLLDQEGKMQSLSDFLGKPLLLYFYPKDMTPGCTIEAREFKKSFKALREAGLQVVGVSKDSVTSHKKFCDKEGLPFPLLSDMEGEVIERYGVWKKKTLYGRTFMGVSRESFLIDKHGNVVKHYEKVKPGEHAKEVLVDVKTLN